MYIHVGFDVFTVVTVKNVVYSGCDTVWLVIADVSEERIASIISVRRVRSSN
jgi:hypothetical protein